MFFSFLSFNWPSPWTWISIYNHRLANPCYYFNLCLYLLLTETIITYPKFRIHISLRNQIFFSSIHKSSSCPTPHSHHRPANICWISTNTSIKFQTFLSRCMFQTHPSVSSPTPISSPLSILLTYCKDWWPASNNRRQNAQWQRWLIRSGRGGGPLKHF